MIGDRVAVSDNTFIGGTFPVAVWTDRHDAKIGVNRILGSKYRFLYQRP